MLLNEIGRFGDNIENLKPSDLTDEVPQNLRKGCVGIFWHVGDNKWIVVSSPVLNDMKNAVEMGQDYDEETNPNDLQIDFNEFHKDIWNRDVLPEHPEWKDFTFDHFSRGRVIFEVLKHKFTIYIPNGSFPQEAVMFLASEFHLPLGGFETNNKIYKKKKDMDTLGNGKNEVIMTSHHTTRQEARELLDPQIWGYEDMKDDYALKVYVAVKAALDSV